MVPLPEEKVSHEEGSIKEPPLGAVTEHFASVQRAGLLVARTVTQRVKFFMSEKGNTWSVKN